jgi:hypothetical protein
MAQHFTGRRFAGLKRRKTSNQRRLIHSQIGEDQLIESFDRGIVFTCDVIQSYIDKGFDTNQILLIIAALKQKVGKQ